MQPMPADPHTPPAAGAPDRAQLLAALERVADPRSGQGLVSAGLVQGLALGSGRAGFMLEAPAGQAALYAPVRDAAEAALLSVAGVERAQVVLTTEDAPGGADAGGGYRVEARARPREATASARLPPDAQAALHARKPVASPEPVPYVRRVVAVASGKGGVGKSTVAVNLAVALAQRRLKVGLMDADIYGPSAPRMLGLTGEPKVTADKKLVPLQAYGLKTVSIGFIVDEGSPMIWRGPMASSALTQFVTDVVWGEPGDELDVLVVDMPPGTGDIQLTLAQKVKVDGAVIVSTPQEVALIDVRRGAGMFRKTGVPLLGVVENMAYFPDPSTGAPIAIFGRGGAQAVARELDTPFLGEVRIDVALREACDAGRPLVDADPQGEVAQVFQAMAAQVAAAVGL
jgi:ATP-binding protein involved in chromosome partitioning